MKLLPLALIALLPASIAHAEVGVGAKPLEGAELVFDGSREMLDSKWTYWQGPGFKSSLPIKWKIVEDPVDKDKGTVVMSDDPVAAGGKYGSADIVTKKAYKDFRLHIEFYIAKEGGNSGVYLQNRYEIQILDGDKTKHGLGAVINETESPYAAYNGVGKWNSYDIVFRAARFKDGKVSEKPLVTMYFNGKKVHINQTINQVWGGPNSGVDGGNDGGKGITDTPQGLKLQAEGHDIRFRNIWIKELDLGKADTDFNEATISQVGGLSAEDVAWATGWNIFKAKIGQLCDEPANNLYLSLVTADGKVVKQVSGWAKGDGRFDTSAEMAVAINHSRERILYRIRMPEGGTNGSFGDDFASDTFLWYGGNINKGPDGKIRLAKIEPSKVDGPLYLCLGCQQNP